MNDSLRTTVFACYHPETIACACIHLAAIHLQFPLGPNWFEIFNVGIETIEIICLSILKLYSLNKPDVIELEKKVAQLRKAQIEARNQKIAMEKKEQQDIAALTTSAIEKTKKSDTRDNQEKREFDTKGKENLEKNASHRKKTHKSRYFCYWDFNYGCLIFFFAGKVLLPPQDMTITGIGPGVPKRLENTHRINEEHIGSILTRRNM